MAEQSPGEMKRFGLLAGALRLAGSMPLPYPRRGDVAAIAAYVREALEPFSFEEVRLVQPTRTFSGQLELEVGGREVRLIEVGPAHTPGDLIVWVPDARIAIAADILFIGVTPIMWAGPLEGWVAALERLLELGAERFVPGHGPVCGPDEVRRLIDYWRWLDQAAGRPSQGRKLARRDGARARPRRRDRGAGLCRLARCPSGRWSACARSTPTVAVSPSCPGRASWSTRSSAWLCWRATSMPEAAASDGPMRPKGGNVSTSIVELLAQAIQARRGLLIPLTRSGEIRGTDREQW